jgi:tetratricopeptide (TPR) repeat protein
MESRDWYEAPAGTSRSETHCSKEGISDADQAQTKSVETEGGEEAMTPRHIHVLFAALIALSACSAVAAAQRSGVLRTVVLVSDADPQPSEPRLYRVYETVEQFTLLLTLANDSSEIVFVDQAALERDVRFTVNRGGQNVPITVRWNPDTWQAGRDTPVTVTPGSSSRMDPGMGVEWRIDLQPENGSRFPAGRYAIEIALGDPRDHISTAAGQSWGGTALRRTSVSVIVAPAATARERAAAFRGAGTIAIRENRQTEAVQMFQRARAADPSDHMSMIHLGDAYLRVKRYAEAVVEFENALRVMPRWGRSPVPMQLALAYVGLGDELNAARVLREQGMSEPMISSELNQYRATIRARK